MAKPYDICIVGGSLTGPVLALALAGNGFRVALIDSAPRSQQTEPEFDGRAYALSSSSVNMLKTLGLWSLVQSQAQPISDIKVSDGVAGQGASPMFLHFDHRELDDGVFGYMLEDRYLRQAIDEALDSADLINPRYETRLSSVEGGHACCLHGADQLDLHASLVVGCDGRSSSVAKHAGIDRMAWDYQQTSIVCSVAHEKDHDGIAHQFFTPAGPLAILPLPGRVSSIVWTEARHRAEEILRLDDDGFLRSLRPVFGSFLGDITLVGRRYSYPLGLSLAHRFVSDRVALAGDAAHGIHPLAGQGLNLGMRDVAALAEVVVDAQRRGEDIGATNVLERYQRWRRFDTAGLALATDGINRLFSNDNPLLRAGRDLGLAAVSRMPGLRQRFMREAAGLTGDMPRLLRGQSL